jgi:hypothetical protein
MPPSVEHSQNASTSEHLCRCGCGASVKPRQRWREPACKARAYRVRHRLTRTLQQQEVWDAGDRYLQMCDDYGRLEVDYEQLEAAFHTFREQHRHCSTPVSEPPRRWLGDACAILGVRPDAEWEAIEGAYKALVKKYHSDRHAGDPAAEARTKDINAAYDEVKRRRGKR